MFNFLQAEDANLSDESTELKNPTFAPCASSKTSLELPTSWLAPEAYVHIDLPRQSTFKAPTSMMSIPVGLKTAVKWNSLVRDTADISSSSSRKR
ncbi:hypothetical protein Vi05172_g4035 [Venturia inaequalis]|nr:hypothetical protein Vi05172_g4035 [Venturia inaequalis]